MKKLFVATILQKRLFEEVIRPQFKKGHWEKTRPANHHVVWEDVEIVISSDGDGFKLGCDGFSSPRNYNMIIPDFFMPNAKVMAEIAKEVDEKNTLKQVRQSLVELARIIGGRLTKVGETPITLFRGQEGDSATKAVSQRLVRVKGAKEVTERLSKGENLNVATDLLVTAQTPKIRRFQINAIFSNAPSIFAAGQRIIEAENESVKEDEIEA